MGVSLAEWKYCKLGEVLTLQRGFDLPHRLRREGAIPIVSSSGVSATHDTARVTAPGIVTGRYGTIGQVFFVTEDFWPLNTTLYVREFRGNNPLYLSYLLRTVDFASHSGKSGVPGVNRNDIHKLPALLPPLHEQRAIAEALSDADNLLTSLEALIAKKRAIKQAAMQQLLTGKIRLPGFFGKWGTKRLRQDIDLLSGHHVMAMHCNTRGEGTPYLTGPADFPDGQIQQTKFTVKPTTLCKAGDILVTVKGSGSGTLIEANGEYCISRQLMAIRASSWNPRFLLYSLLQSASRIGDASTGLIPGLSRADIMEQELPIPSEADEQTAIAAVLSDMDAEFAALERRRTKTQAIKQGMMQQLLTGRVRLVEPAPAEVNP